MIKKNQSQVQQQSKLRRGKKDPQSRDFICKCGKSYLSYAAVYTHVKNKHDSQKQYIENIAKPLRQQVTRGRRRKQGKKIKICKQTQALSIIQDAILDIYQQLKIGNDTIGKIVLQGNQQVSLQELKKDYEIYCELKKSVYKLNFNLFQEPDKHPQLYLIVQFQKKLNKHFTSSIASKLRWFLNLIAHKRGLIFDKKQKNETKQKFQKNILESISLFEGAQNINKIVINALIKWTKAIQKTKHDQQQSKSVQNQQQEEEQQQEEQSQQQQGEESQQQQGEDYQDNN